MLKIFLMKTFVTIFVLSLTFSTTLHAQKCKYTINKTDAFSGETVKSITAQILGSWNIGFTKTGESYHAEINLLLSGHQKEIASQGDSVLIALEGQKPVVLFVSSQSVPKHDVNGTVVKTWYKINYAINEATLTQLNEGKIKAIRVFVGSAIHETEIPERNADKIQKAVSCILQ